MEVIERLFGHNEASRSIRTKYKKYLMANAHERDRLIRIQKGRSSSTIQENMRSRNNAPPAPPESLIYIRNMK